MYMYMQKVFNVLIATTLVVIILCYNVDRRSMQEIYQSKVSVTTFKPQVAKMKISTRNNQFRTDAVIILTQARSGSSILGELFRQRYDVAYFYEPLFGFDLRPCDSLIGHRIATLEQIIRCNFTGMKERFDQVLTDHGPFYPSCKAKDHCFKKGGTCCELLSRMTGSTDNNCPAPVNQLALEKRCRQSQLVVLKVITLCQLKALVPMLNNVGLNVKVINLVRDPRATIKSRISQSRHGGITKIINSDRISSLADIICEQLELNAVFVENNIGDVIPRDKYLRVRHEEFCMDPNGVTQKLYDFVGLNMNNQIKNWLKTKTSTKNSNTLSDSNTYGTNRNPSYVVSAWRSILDLEHIVEIQKRCGKAMKKLGYKLITTKKELLNITMNLF